MYTLEATGGLGRVLLEKHEEQEQLQLARLTLMYGSHDSATRPMSKHGGPEVVETRSGEQIKSSGPLPPTDSRDSYSSSAMGRGAEDVSDYRSPNDAYAYSHARPRTARLSHVPLPPSPLGLSNYDALDLEDILDPYGHLDEEYDMADRLEHANDLTLPP